MTKLENYNDDGANKQAQGVLAILQYIMGSGIEDSWDKKWKRYRADVWLARWENCREQGYVVSLSAENMNTLHIAWFEHRNSDSIHAIKWHQKCLINSPTIDTADFGDECYSNKYDTSFDVHPHEVATMAEWIRDRLLEHWADNKKGKDTKETK